MRINRRILRKDLAQLEAILSLAEDSGCPAIHLALHFWLTKVRQTYGLDPGEVPAHSTFQKEVAENRRWYDEYRKDLIDQWHTLCDCPPDRHNLRYLVFTEHKPATDLSPMDLVLQDHVATATPAVKAG